MRIHIHPKNHWEFDMYVLLFGWCDQTIFRGLHVKQLISRKRFSI